MDRYTDNFIQQMNTQLRYDMDRYTDNFIEQMNKQLTL